MPVNHLTTYTLDELKAIRDGWLQEGLDSHTIENARLVAHYLGNPFIVENWSNDNWVWRYNDLKVTLYRFTSNHFMETLDNGIKNNALNRVETVVITVGGQVYCRYKIAKDPDCIQGMDWDDAVFIPGPWIDTIEQFVGQASLAYTKQQEEHDTLAIKRLKTMLLLD